MIYVPRDGYFDLLKAIFRPRCMAMVKIVGIRVIVSVNMVTVRMGTTNSHCHVYCTVTVRYILGPL